MFKSKFSLFFLSILISSVLLFSCKKDNTAVDGTKWSVDNFNFSADKKGGFLFQNDTANLFGATATTKDAILILFKNKPTAGVYNVANSQVKTNPSLYEDNDCTMIVTNKSGGVAAYLPLVDEAGIVDISVSGKKLTANFSNVKLGYIDGASGDIVESLVSGTIIEK